MNEQLITILKSKDLSSVTMDLVEAVLDNQITDELMKEVPILKSLIALKNIYSSISDRIFIKKATNVLLELSDVSWKERIELTRELDNKHSTGAERILMSIDKLETIEKCKVFGRLCKLRAYKNIFVEDFLRLTKVIQDAFLDDLVLIKDFKKGEGKEIWEGDYYPIISLGLLFQEPSEQQKIELNHSRYEEPDPEIIGGEIKFNYLLTEIGEKLLEHYAFLFPEEE